MPDKEENLMDKLIGKKLEDITFTFSFRLSINQIRFLANDYPVNVNIKGIDFVIQTKEGREKDNAKK